MPQNHHNNPQFCQQVLRIALPFCQKECMRKRPWLNYPANVMVIISACISIYLVRLIALHAYHPPKTQSRTVITLIISIVISIAIAIAVSTALLTTQIAEKTNDYSAIILFIVSAAGLLGILIAAVIKKVNNNKDNEND